MNSKQTDNIDKDIFNELRKPGQWLDGYTVVNLGTIDDVINQFKNEISGIVAWDPKVDATVNVATTAAGVENTPAVMYGGKLYNKLIGPPYNITVNRNLNGQFTGVNAKTDAYYWAKANFLDTASEDQCKTMSILEDGYSRTPDRIAEDSQVSSRDYLVKNRAFVFDLSPWSDEKPNDAPEQTLGNDYNCFTSIMQAGQNKWGNKWPIEVIGFTPWWHKYTTFDGKSAVHDTVSTEWKDAEILSTYGASITQIGDTFGSSNASFHSWAPYPVKLPPQEAPARKSLENKTYICYFNGDHDGSTINHSFNNAWNDPRRGQIPIGWGIVPGIIKDFPDLYSYIRDTATRNDYFWAGSSGAGYSNPGYIDSGVWKKFNEYYYDRAGYTMTGFILNGNAGTVTDTLESMYRDFSGDGITGLTQHTQDPDFDVRNGNVAVASILTDIHRADVDAAVNAIYNITAGLPNPGSQPNFIVARSSFAFPSTLEMVHKKLLALYPQYNYEAVDPYTLFSLVRQKVLGQQGYDAVVVNVQVPERMVINETYDVKVTLRNTGTNIWTRNDLYRLGSGSTNQFVWSGWQDGGENPGDVAEQRAYLSAADSIAPQQTKTFSFKITAPSAAGTYNFGSRMVRDGVAWFGSIYTRAIQVVAPGEREARLVSISAPDEIAAGQTVQVSFTLKNIGTAAWTAANNYRLGALAQSVESLKAVPNKFEWSGFTDGGSSGGVENQRAYLGSTESIASGQSKTFTFNITAPYGRGKYVLSARMVRDGYGWFGDDAIKEITVVPAVRNTNDARLVRISVPEYIAPNEKVNVSVSVRNAGSAMWLKSQNYRLGATSTNQLAFTDMQYGGYSNSAADQRVFLSDADVVEPEETKTFNFAFTAPSATGIYKLSTRMVRDGVEWFGDQIDMDIKVQGELDSSIVLDGIPSQVTAGTEVGASVIFKNTGTQQWRRDTLHKLGSTINNQIPFVTRDDPWGNSTGYNTADGKEQRVYLPTWATIPQGQENQFGITLKAPDVPGTYTFEIRMVRDGVAWYGQTLTKTIQVVDKYQKYINVGGAALTDEKGWQWLADQPYTAGSWGYTGTTSTASTINSIGLNNIYYNLYGESVYKSLRKGASFGYRFDNVPNGTYKAKLLIADLESAASGQNLTDVVIEGYEVLRAFDAYKNRSGYSKGMYTDDLYITVSDSVLNVDLGSSAGNAYVNGLIVERIK